MILFLLGFLVISFQRSIAQEQRIAPNETPESEVSAASNPIDEENIVVAAINDFSRGQVSNSTRLSVYYSLDAGSSWQKSNYSGPDVSAENGVFVGDPVLSFDSKGVAYLAHLVWLYQSTVVETRLYMATSEDKGQSWSSVQLIGGITSVFDKPWITADISPESPHNDNVYLAFVRASGSPFTRFEIFVATKKADDPEFSGEAVKVHQTRFRVVQSPSLHSNVEGQLFVSFIANDGEKTSLYMARSDDGGDSFQPEVKIADLRMYLPNFQVLPSIQKTGLDKLYACPQLAIDLTKGEYGGRIYMAFTDKENGTNNYGLDVYLSHSDDNGSSWSMPQSVHLPGFINNHQYYPSIKVSPKGTLLVSWYDRRDDPLNVKTHFYFNYSEDGGARFSNELVLTNTASDFSIIGSQNNGLGIGEYTSIVMSGAHAIPVWADGRRNDGSISLYNAKILLENETATLESTGGIQAGFSVEDPVPNPSPGKSFFNIELAESDFIQTSIYNQTGQLVMSLPEQEFLAGKHQIQLDFSRLSAGVYFCQFQGRESMIIKRVLYSR